MKTNTWIRSGLAAFLLLIVQGCNDFGITTVVSTDGSVDRMIRLKTGAKDLSEVWTFAFPLPNDSSWRTTWQVTGAKDSNIFTAAKHFESFEALAAEYARVTDTTKLKIVVDVQKRFRWFYTYYEYAETYRAFNPLILIPAREFFTPDELRLLMLNEEKNDTLDARRKEWQDRNNYELVHRRLVAAAARMNDPELPVSLFESNREELFRSLTDDHNYKGVNSENDITRRVADLVQGILKTKAVQKIRPAMGEAVVEMFRLDEIRNKAEGSYTNTVVMPGVILETNAKEVSGSRVMWKFSEKQLTVLDIEMRVESRVVNTWTVIVSGAVVLGLLLVPIVLQVRRRRE
jgi:hypothetical protein